MNCFVRFVALSAIFIAPLAGYTQTYPSKPVRILVATPSGGPLDVVARGSAQVLTPVLGQPFVVENRAGADSMIAGEACARSAPDGHVLCAIDSLGTTLSPVIRASMPYDPARDLAPVIHYGYVGSAILVHPSVPANTLRELFDLARAKPGSLTWGSFGRASGPNIYMEWMRHAKGINFMNVPYKAASQAYPAMLAGEVQIAWFSAGAAAGAVKAGKARALAINLERRSSHLPDVPTYKEAGMEIPLVTTFGLYAPARTPKDIIQRVNLELANGLINNLEMRRKFITAAGVEIEPPAGGSPEEFAAYLLAERERWASIVKTANIKRE